MLVGEVEKLQCRVPSDSDAAVRVSQVLQLGRLVQASQYPVRVNLSASLHLQAATAINMPFSCSMSEHLHGSI